MRPSRSPLVIRLTQESDFDRILQHNLQQIADWTVVYPNHESWIRNVIQEFKAKKHYRIAFGGVIETGDTSKLCCSVILKKTRFSANLEIKNLIVFEENSKHEQKYIDALIKHILQFATKRGYRKLVVELLNRKDKALIKAFLDNNFIITGNHIEKYNEGNGVVILTANVDPVYGFDPYDNIAAVRWILSKYFKSDNSSLGNQIAVGDNGEESSIRSMKFYNGSAYKKFPEAKFNMRNEAIIITESYCESYNLQYLSDILITEKVDGKPLIFDFSENGGSATYLRDNAAERFVIFDRSEIEKLMGFDGFNNKPRRRFPFSQIGGLLLICNNDQELFPFEKVSNISSDIRKKLIYIKLGDYGQCIQEGMPIVLAYYPDKSKRSKLEIWGLATLCEGPQRIDLKKDFGAAFIPSDKKNKEVKNDLANALFFRLTGYDHGQNTFEEIIPTRTFTSFSTEDYERVDVLWSTQDFTLHNNYNETNKVIGFAIDNFTNLNEDGKRIDVQDILDDESYLQDPENSFDFYLSKKEVTSIFQRLRRTGVVPNSPRNFLHRVEHNGPISLLYITAMPLKRDRLDNGEHNKIQIICKASSKTLKMTPVLLDSTFNSLLRMVTEIDPDIIHFSGHSDENGIALVNEETGVPHIISASQLKSVLEMNTNVKFVMLSSCLSEGIAEQVSGLNIYAFGFSEEVCGKDAVRFVANFYQSFSSAPERATFKKRIELGLINATGNHPKIKYVLYKDGQKIENVIS